ncbi:hypothetical protein COO09_09785 [Rhizorhabdus dicambivorans]|uniref:Uncharacterized protein n=2 Tax=Rhizorhabdus dicambivorans TaxID=1850238 RepID=A0A2A4FX66_9SPHN|nr:hypothetical protein CMV14_13995 [Rhizorhabdus dicambivorans]PCE42293.1 hypothetical protein COO09_09785 [Rhizorhabdus dicambivorans]
MYPSVTLCRAQEAIQLDRARDSTLENVRAIAAKAAKSWGIEAVAAEAREARGERVRLHRLAHFVLPCPIDSLLSENPDRGLANA